MTRLRMGRLDHADCRIPLALTAATLTMLALGWAGTLVGKILEFDDDTHADLGGDDA